MEKPQLGFGLTWAFHVNKCQITSTFVSSICDWLHYWVCSGLADIIDRKGNKKGGKALHDHWPYYIWNVIICSQCTEVIASFDKGHMEYRMDKAVHCHYVGHRVINSIYCFHEYIVIVIIIGTCDTSRKSVCRKLECFRWRLDQRFDICEYEW